MNNNLEPIQCPTGRWYFAGFSLPGHLVWERKDGSPMTEKDWHAVQHCSAPALFGYRTVSFATKDEALAAVEQPSA